MPDRIVQGASAPVSPATVELPAHVAALALFTICQLRSRLERITGDHPGKIDQTLIGNARDAATAVRAAIELDRRR